MTTQLQSSVKDRVSKASVSDRRSSSVSRRNRVTPSIVDANHQPFSLDQELEPFGKWVGQPIWIPPQGHSRELAESMLRHSGMIASSAQRWAALEENERHKFTQVREFQLHRASIRLPEGKVFVSVTERADFDKITDRIPDCVRTRLEEFLQGPGNRPGVKVYYLKPLCVEIGDQLIFTTREEVHQAMVQIRQEVMAEFRQMYIPHHLRRSLLAAADLAMWAPRALITARRKRAERKLDAYQAKLEYNRRRLALRAASLHHKCRTNGCTFDEMLALTNPLERVDVIEQYSTEKQLSAAKRKQLLHMSSVALPWFITIPLTAYYAASAVSSLSVLLAPPVLLCDPAFVAEMPGSKGVVLKIGHFDEINGVTHVEI